MSKLVFICGAIILFGALWALPGEESAPQEPRKPQKIISLAPAITETLFALGLDEKIAGVTQFCAWPEAAAQKPKIGGFREVNLETIARTGADLVVLPQDMAHFAKAIEDLGVPVMIFRYNSLANYLEDVGRLGKITDSETRATELADNFAKHIKPKNGGHAPTVLFVILNPDEYDRPISDMTIIGADGFYNGLIKAAGGQNAYRGKTPFPRLSLESVIALDPEIIAIGAPALRDTSALKKRWREIGHLRGRLLILNEPGDTIPGPRSLETLKKLEGAIKPVRGDS